MKFYTYNPVAATLAFIIICIVILLCVDMYTSKDNVKPESVLILASLEKSYGNCINLTSTLNDECNIYIEAAKVIVDSKYK